MSQPVAIIEFSFLEAQKKVKGWDNTFYDLFKLFYLKEEDFGVPMGENNDRVVFVVDNSVYSKEYGEKRILIYTSAVIERLEGLNKSHQNYLFYIYDRSESDRMDRLIDKFKSYLSDCGKKYILHHELPGIKNTFSQAEFYLGIELLD